MRPDDVLFNVRQGERTARYEEVESRLVFTAHPLGELVVEHLDDALLKEQTANVAPAANAANDIGLEGVRDLYGFAGAGQTVAVIDSGIAYDHTALGGGLGESYRVVGGWDFTEENDADPYDDGPAGFHGTHVAGIIGSDDPTYTGVAPEVDLVALRVFNDQGEGQFEWIENALQWVHDNLDTFENPITTVNMSLGVQWNGEGLPPSARLEDEFAQLQEHGVFISVAAGNSFDAQNAARLNYPASSPLVVSVGSVDAEGRVSDFSQRSDRTLFAPGERITSTVPDYVFGVDGDPNDFEFASGTSMAAPYVAGASVLVRQAMEFNGYQNITQDTIYDQLRSTSDLVFDSASSSLYRRVNIGRAIDVLMPDDDFGSTAGAAKQIGRLGESLNIAGLIGNTADLDFFQFTADAAGRVALQVDAFENLQADVGVLGKSVTQDSDGTYRFDVQAGETVSFSLATSAGIGRYDVALGLTPQQDQRTVVDWGVIEQAEFDVKQIGGEAWRQVTASRDGLLTIEAVSSTGASSNNAVFEIYDANGRLLVSSSAAAGGARADLQAAADATYLVRIENAGPDARFKLTNLVSASQGVVEVWGTDGDDAFQFDARAGFQVTVNGVSYDFAASEVNAFTLRGGGGEDTLRLQAAADNDFATLRVGQTELSNSRFRLLATQFEDVQLFSGGGADFVKMYDSAGDDQYVGRADSSSLRGDGFQNVASVFENVRVYATAGGADTAQLYDAAGDDVFVGRAAWSSLRGEGYYNYVVGFENVRAYATAGGDDTAYFYDSAGDDRFVGRSRWSSLQGEGFDNFASGFENVQAFANAGGNDLAQFYDSAGDDRYVGRGSFSSMQGAGYFNAATAFENVRVYATAGGDNLAQLYDTAGDDVFVGREAWSSLRGDGYYNYVLGFENVRAYATAGGADAAYFYDSAGDDRFVGRDRWSSLRGDDYYNYVVGFESVAAYATSGGNDIAYFRDSNGADVFEASDQYATMVGAGYSNYARGFGQVFAYATNGRDTARLLGSARSDLLRYGAFAELSGEAYSNAVRGFDRVEVDGGSGGFDRAVFESLGADDYFLGRGNLARLNIDAVTIETREFEFITARARSNEKAAADVSAVDYFFALDGAWDQSSP